MSSKLNTAAAATTGNIAEAARVHLPAAGEAGGGPAERMCASMTPLPDGLLLLLGARHKEGIYQDMWWLDVAGDSVVLPSPFG
ncbi:hypothetical protein COO60DRAFT_1699485 [Scenedesmus sp. NREL 46B-D3]|nr:hypothetical protein COO60DRAFT_1699485 [Scenedesmus sp. NREL 46B-D3]